MPGPLLEICLPKDDEVPAEAPAAPPLPRPARLDDRGGARRLRNGRRERAAAHKIRTKRRVAAPRFRARRRRAAHVHVAPHAGREIATAPDAAQGLRSDRHQARADGAGAGSLKNPTHGGTGTCEAELQPLAARGVRLSWTWPTRARSTSSPGLTPRRTGTDAAGPAAARRRRGGSSSSLFRPSVLQAASLQFWSVTHLDVALTQSAEPRFAASIINQARQRGDAVRRRGHGGAPRAAAVRAGQLLRSSTRHLRIAARAARQSYGFGDARYASHPRRAAAGGEDAGGGDAAAARCNQTTHERLREPVARGRPDARAPRRAARWRGRPTAFRPRRASVLAAPAPAAGRARAAARRWRGPSSWPTSTRRTSRASPGARPGPRREPRHRGDDVALLPEPGDYRRAGSTALAVHLTRHPSIAFSRDKELHFFDKNESLCPGPLGYLLKFPPRDELKATAEATPFYIASTEACTHMAAQLGRRATYVLIVREPVARAYSEYQMKHRRVQGQDGFEKALQAHAGAILARRRGRPAQRDARV